MGHPYPNDRQGKGARWGAKQEALARLQSHLHDVLPNAEQVVEAIDDFITAKLARLNAGDYLVLEPSGALV